MTRLRVGFLVDKTQNLPAWEYETLIELLKTPYIGEVLLIESAYHLDKKIVPLKKPFIFKLYQIFENIWFRKLPDASSSICLKNLQDSNGKLLFIKAAVEEEYTSLNIDLLYVSQSLKGVSIPNVPKYGIWYIQFGAYNGIKSELPAFWEVMNNEITTKAQLIVILKEGIQRKVVYDATSTTVPFSVKNNFNSIAWKASLFLIVRLRKLYHLGPNLFFDQSESFEFEEYDLRGVKRVYPSNLVMIWMAFRNTIRYLIYKIKAHIKKKKFILCYSMKSLEMDKMNVDDFCQIIPPKRNFWADPFVMKYENNYYVFFEEGAYPEYKAKIAVIEINQDGLCSESRVILEKPYHMSYPFVFENNGSYYMIPETSANKTVELYHCIKFPHEWEFSKYLMKDLILQDSTLFFYNELWWLFGTTKTIKSATSNDQLMIYYCKDFKSSEWISHPGNPVVTDVANCRPGGKIFLEGNRIFRPAQNNASRQYGYSLRINEIEILTTTEFKEREVFEISPKVYRKYAAIHTLNATAGLIVIDGINA